MRFNGGADLRPTRGIDPDTAILYRKLRSGWLFDKFWHSRRARFPFLAAAGDQFGKTGGYERRCVDLTIALHCRLQQLRYATQNLHSAIFGVAAQTNYRRNVESELPERFRQTVRGPVLFLARNPGAGTEITNQIGLDQNNSRRAITFRCRWVAASLREVGDRKSGIHDRVHRHHRAATASAVKSHQSF